MPGVRVPNRKILQEALVNLLKIKENWKGVKASIGDDVLDPKWIDDQIKQADAALKSVKYLLTDTIK